MNVTVCNECNWDFYNLYKCTIVLVSYWKWILSCKNYIWTWENKFTITSFPQVYFFFSFSSSMKSSQHGEATYISTMCWSHINQPKQIMQWQSVRWGDDKLIPYKWGIKQCIMTFDFSSLNVIAKMWGSKSQCDLLFHIYVV